MFRKTSVVVLATALLLTGCSTGVSQVKSISPLSLEEVTGSRLVKLTNAEKESLIFQYVSDSITVNEENLIEPEQSDTLAINNLLSKINNDLANGTSNALSEDYANYLLTEFARTAYTWKQDKVSVVGFDPATRLYFVDVDYSTTGNYKMVIPSSKIPLGHPDGEILKEKRYTDYISYLQYKVQGDAERASTALAHFTSAWGTPESVLAEQQGVSLLSRVKESGLGEIGALTYAGLTMESKLNLPAKMTIRYVFKYSFNLGEINDLGVHALYVKNFELQNSESLLTSYTSSSSYGVEVLKPFIDRTISSYHKASQASDYIGLYDLHSDFGTIDKYYEALQKHTYRNVRGYNFKVLQRINDNTVAVQVNRISRYRAVGSEMSLPTYEDTLIFYMTLDKDDKIRIRSVSLISSKLLGEPMSVIRNVTGVSDMIQYSGNTFTDSNKAKVEEALKQFSEVTFEGKVDSEKFTSIVDVGVSESTLLKISDNVQAIPNATHKVNYIASWNTKTNVFVSVTLREVFTTSEGTFDTESVVDLVNRSGVWKVVNYTRTLSVKTSGNTLNTKNALSENGSR